MGTGMEDFRRFAIYYAPVGGLANFGAAWLGWDAVRGRAVTQPCPPCLPRPMDRITEAPRKYGLHGTIKPPFRLAPGRTAADLDRAAAALCARLAPVTLDCLTLARLGGFLALVPRGDAGALSGLAAGVVTGLDGFRAAPTEAEIARRHPERLSPRQRGYLSEWGYPYVLEEFRFHITLTGKLLEGEAVAVQEILAPLIAPHLPAPFHIDALCLFGEAADGRFYLIHRYPLTGAG
jgi:putative phosphonate metabolism protein